MKKATLLLFLILCSISAFAHPGIGLVYDGDRTIYYTDLTHIWKLDTETGEASIFIENIHSHELWLDESGALFGEHYWYDEPNQVFRHYIWMANSDGEFSKISETITGENEHFSFVRNSIDQSFRLLRTANAFEIIQIDSASSTTIGEFSFNDPSWIFFSDSDHILIADYPSIYSFAVSSKILRTLADDLTQSKLPFSLQDEHHHIYGIWQDGQSNTYVALFGGRQVVKIDSDFNQETVYNSSFFWSPVNGLFDKNDNLWLMESTFRGAARVRKVQLEG